MRKSSILLPEVKARILRLKGQPITLTVHDGRQKYHRVSGTLVGVYPSVFTVKLDRPKSIDRMSWSYAELLCGQVRIALRHSDTAQELP